MASKSTCIYDIASFFFRNGFMFLFLMALARNDDTESSELDTNTSPVGFFLSSLAGLSNSIRKSELYPRIK